MDHYIHHVPGRLRVRTPSVKRNTDRAAGAADLLGKVQGVKRSDINTLTGSIVIHYDRHSVEPDALLQTLHAEGYVPTTLLQTPVGASAVSTGEKSTHRESSLTNKVTNAVAGKLVEFVLERSALALIAAIL